MTTDEGLAAKTRMFLRYHGEAPSGRTTQPSHSYYFTQEEEDGKPEGTDLNSLKMPFPSP